MFYNGVIGCPALCALLFQSLRKRTIFLCRETKDETIVLTMCFEKLVPKRRGNGEICIDMIGNMGRLLSALLVLVLVSVHVKSIPSYRGTGTDTW
jgi:hypothetical protein